MIIAVIQRPDVRHASLIVGQAGGLLAMHIPAREPFVAYLLVHAAMLRRRRDVASGAIERLEKHAQALELLAAFVRNLPTEDERLLMLTTLAVRDGQFMPGPTTEHALSQFAASSREACDAFLDNLVRTARDDALARARAHGHLPPRPR